MLNMAVTVADIVRQAAELDSADRAKVIKQLLSTFDPPGEDVTDFEEAWSEELDRREHELDRGEVQGVSWDTFRASLKR